MTMRIASFLFALLAISVHASEVRLGPEVPLSPNSPPQAAFGKQISPDVATDGNDFLAVWTDSRSLSAAARPDIAFRGETWMSRLRADGTPVEPFGRRLASFVNAIVASNGDGYLVAGNDSALHVVHVDGDGSPSGEEFSVQDRRPVELVSNGSTYLLFSADQSPTFPQRIHATLLDGSGRRLFDSAEVFQEVIAAGAHDGNYYFIEISSGLVPVLRTINASGDVTIGRALPIPLTQSPFVAAFGRDTILIAWTATNRIEYAVVTYDGALVKTQTLPFGTAAPSTAAWDGRQFLLTFFDMAVRIAADGTLIDPPALPLRIPLTPVVVSNGNRGLLVWLDDRFTREGDIVARPFGSFDDLAIRDDSATLVSWSGPPALHPQIARSGGHQLAVWADPEAAMLRGSLDGRPLTIASIGFLAGHTLAAGKSTFLVAWYDDSRREILARRISIDGNAIDANPLALATDVLPWTVIPFVDVLAATFDGFAYQVVWNNREIATRYIFEDGRMSEQIAASGDPNGRGVYSPRLLPTGNGNFLAYAIYNPPGPIAGDWISPPWSLITGVPVSVLSEATFTPALFQSERVAELDATISGDRVTYVWSSDGDIFIAQSTLDAHWLVRPIRVVDNSSLSCAVRAVSRPAAMWNGQETVIAWTEGNGCDVFSSTDYTVRAIRLNADLSPLDRQPIELAPGATPDGPSIIPTPEGVAIAYSRFDDSNGGAPRAFLRVLIRSDAPLSRRRGVRP